MSGVSFADPRMGPKVFTFVSSMDGIACLKYAKMLVIFVLQEYDGII
jgi:hypothetical protein